MATKKKTAAPRASTKSSSGSTPKAKNIVKKTMESTMHGFKHHQLKSGPGGKAGAVKNPKQAIAIGLSEARKAGADIPPAPGTKGAKRTPRKSAGSRKTSSPKKK